MVNNKANLNINFLQDSVMPVAILGGGYSSDRQMPAKFKCLKDGIIVPSEGSKSVIKMSDSVQFSEVTQELNNALASSFEVGFFTNSFVDNYARYIKTASYSSAFYFYESVQLPTFTWQPPGYGTEVLTEYGADVYYSSLENFRDFCGDQYFQEFNYGGNIFASLKINFNSTDDKETFDSASSSALNINEATGSIQSIALKYSLGGQLEISATQVGGNPSQLASIFSESQSGYYISKCSITDVSNCDKVVSNLLSYAAGDFAEQMNLVNGTIVGNTSPVGYVQSNFSDSLGLNNSVSIITQNISTARNNLTQIYNNQLDLKSNLEIQLSTDSTYNSTVIKQMLSTIADNIDIIMDQSSGAIGCYFIPQDCVEITKEIIGSLKPIETSYVEV